jgi:hypothetical protein
MYPLEELCLVIQVLISAGAVGRNGAPSAG